MRINLKAVDDPSRYIIFLNGAELNGAFEADEETGRVWLYDNLKPAGYTVMTGDVVIHEKKNARPFGAIAGVRLNGGSQILLNTPYEVKEGDTVTISVTINQNGGIIEFIDIIYA